jgi:hypothetical protein
MNIKSIFKWLIFLLFIVIVIYFEEIKSLTENETEKVLNVLFVIFIIGLVIYFLYNIILAYKIKVMLENFSSSKGFKVYHSEYKNLIPYEVENFFFKGKKHIIYNQKGYIYVRSNFLIFARASWSALGGARNRKSIKIYLLNKLKNSYDYHLFRNLNLTNNSFINKRLNNFIYKGESVESDSLNLNSKFFINSKNQVELRSIISQIESNLINLYNNLNLNNENIDFNIEINKSYIMVSFVHKNYKILPQIYEFVEQVVSRL